jgi:hypothetical protein
MVAGGAKISPRDTFCSCSADGSKGEWRRLCSQRHFKVDLKHAISRWLGNEDNQEIKPTIPRLNQSTKASFSECSRNSSPTHCSVDAVATEIETTHSISHCRLSSTQLQEAHWKIRLASDTLPRLQSESPPLIIIAHGQPIRRNQVRG